jgi:hypothetical protein
MSTALAVSTIASYQPHERAFLAFCANRGLSPFPLAEATVLGFVCFYFNLQKPFSAVKTALAAVRNLARTLGYETDVLGSLRLELLKRGYKRNIPGRPMRPARVPITVWVLLALLPQLLPGEDTLFGICVVGVFGLFRGGELTYKGHKYGVLRRSHVTWFPDCVVIHLKESKTDVDRRGVDIKLFKLGGPICPWLWLRRIWESASNQHRDAPLFQTTSGDPVAYSTMLAWLKSALQRVNIPSESVGLHSFRIGGATSLAMLGVPAHAIRIFGRWASHCYMIYIRTAESELRGFMARMAGAPSQPGRLFGALSLAQASEVTEESLESVAP